MYNKGYVIAKMYKFCWNLRQEEEQITECDEMGKNFVCNIWFEQQENIWLKGHKFRLSSSLKGKKIQKGISIV